MKRSTLLVAWAFLVVTAGLAAQEIGIATPSAGSIHNSAGTMIAKIANEKAGIRATVQPYGAATVYLPAVNAGAIDFGIGNVYELTLAYEGNAFFAGRPNPNLRAVAVVYPLRNTIYVKKSSSLKTISDLKGHRMPDGYTSQKIIVPMLDAIYSTAGLTRADMKAVPVPTVVGGADAMASGKTDGFFFSLGSAKVREVDAAVGGIRALEIDASPQNQANLDKQFPGAYFRPEKPGPDNPGVVEPVYSMAYDSVIFTSTKTPDDVVYRLTKAIYENKPELARGFAVFNLLEPNHMAKKLSVPYHPGAIKFYKEKGIWPPK